MTIDPRSLTQEERAILDHIALTAPFAWRDADKCYEYAARVCEPIILARRALFGEPASEGVSTDPNCSPENHDWDFGFCRTCKAIGRSQKPASEGGKVECPNCRKSVHRLTDHCSMDQGPHGPLAYDCEPAQPESVTAKKLFYPIATEEDWEPDAAPTSDKGKGLYNKFIVERADGKSAPGEKHDGCEYFVLDLTHDKFAQPALRAYADACAVEYPKLSDDLRGKFPEPVTTSEMPEAVEWALQMFEMIVNPGDDPRTDAQILEAKDALESWWRSQQTQPAPAKVRMSNALERVLDCAEMDANRDRMGGLESTAATTMAAIRVVRAQAEQAQAVKLPKVREALWLLNKRTVNTSDIGVATAALAELDAAEKVTG